jgi:tRNA1Val (adenine37-N6)-methyltransferase
MILKENERIDDLEYKNLKIIQNKEGFCFGIDSVIISDFAKDIKNNSMGADLGTGTGIISILLSAKTKLKKIYGIEIQSDVADMAKRSVKLNSLEERIEIINSNIKNIENSISRESLDFIVTNPPYKKLETGKINENKYKVISRHEHSANLEDFIKITKFLLKDKGALYMVHRPERLADIIELMRKYKIEPKKIRFVHSNINKEVNLVLVKAIKNAKPFLKIEKPLIIYDEKGQYTDEIYEIYNKERK